MIVRSLSQIPKYAVFKLMFDKTGDVYYDILDEPSGYKFPIPMWVRYKDPSPVAQGPGRFKKCMIWNKNKWHYYNNDGLSLTYGYRTNYPKLNVDTNAFDAYTEFGDKGLTGDEFDDMASRIIPLRKNQVKMYLDGAANIKNGQEYVFKTFDYLANKYFDIIGRVIDIDAENFNIIVNFHDDIFKDLHGYVVANMGASISTSSYAILDGTAFTCLMMFIIMKEYTPVPKPKPEPGDEESPLKPHKPKK